MVTPRSKQILLGKSPGVSALDIMQIVNVCNDNNVEFMDTVAFLHHDSYADCLGWCFPEGPFQCDLA